MKNVFLAAVMVMVSSFAVAQNSSSSYKVALKQLLESSGSEAAFKVVLDQMFAVMRQQKSNVPAEVWSALEEDMRKTSLDDIVEMLTPVYQKHLTEGDLRKVIEFYQTPAGKKYAAQTPVIMQESMQVGQQWGMKVGQRIMQRLSEKGY